MVHDRANLRMKMLGAALALAATALVSFGGPAAHAQNIMRTPNLNIGSRIPSVDVGRMTAIDRVSPRLRSPCDYAYRGSDGECSDRRPITSVDGGGTGGGGNVAAKIKTKNSGPSGKVVQTVLDRSVITGQFVAEIDGSLSVAQADALARRHGLVRLQSLQIPLLESTFGLFRVADPSKVQTASRAFAADASVRSLQPNFRYLLQQQKAVLTEGDPAQYAVAKLRLPEAHALARGANVTVAVIDSGIDGKHPELANAVAGSFDAFGSAEGAHIHGTGIAGAIVAHARLMGSAPAARLLAIRAFGVAQNGAESSSFVILKALDYAASHGAQVINMSFAGPKDGLIDRGIAAVAAKGIVMVAASGNAGPKSPPLYPAANPNVIAVSGTDAQGKLFAASNRGGHIAVAAPGADIFLPAPDEKYQMTSGTSFSAAYVSGLAALMLERNPSLKPDEVRAILMKTARDLGTPGRDDLFGAGEADAFAAVSAVLQASEVPVAAVSDRPAAEKDLDRQEPPASPAMNQPSATMASGKSADAEASRPAAQ